MLDGQMNLDTLARLQRRGRVDVGAHELPCRQLDLDVTVLAQVRDPCHGAAQRISAGRGAQLDGRRPNAQAGRAAGTGLAAVVAMQNPVPDPQGPGSASWPCSSLLVPMNEATNVWPAARTH